MSNYMRTKEYQSLLVMKKSQLVQAASGQSSIIEHGIKVPDSSMLVAVFGSISSILGFFFLNSKSRSLGLAIATVYAAMLPDTKNTVQRLAVNGLNGLNEIAGFMDRNTNYDLVEINTPFLEYEYSDSTENWRIVQGKPAITRLRVASTGKWIIAT